MIRIAFRHIDSSAWQGGANYLANVCRVLREHFPNEIEPIVFHGPAISNEDRQRLRKLQGEGLVEHSAFDPGPLAKRRWSSLIRGCDRTAMELFKSNEIDVVFENADFYGRRFPLPTLAWVPDFQHRYFPRMFSKKQYWRREIGFRLQFHSGRQVVVSSNDAANDCKKFYGCKDDQISVVQFSIPMQGEQVSLDDSSVIKQYDLPERFFLLPNQFWNHKNHSLVLDALAELSADGDCPVVAVTGGASHPSCVKIHEKMCEQVETLGLQDHFRMLGRIPVGDLKTLMISCTALINPSLFEGWSTTIEEAKAFGVPLLLSDLEVHLEQASGKAKFFDRHSSAELAQAMRSMMSRPNETRPDQKTLEVEAGKRQELFAEAFRSAIIASQNRFEGIWGRKSKE